MAPVPALAQQMCLPIQATEDHTVAAGDIGGGRPSCGRRRRGDRREILMLPLRHIAAELMDMSVDTDIEHMPMVGRGIAHGIGGGRRGIGQGAEMDMLPVALVALDLLVRVH